MSSRRYAASAEAHRWRTVALALGLLLSVLIGVAGSLAYSAMTRPPAGPSRPGSVATTPASTSATATIAVP